MKPGPSIKIRPATVDDLGAINRIYNHYVEHSTSTYEEQANTLEQRVAWFEEHDARHPVIVAHENGVVVGWGSLTQFRPRAAYRFTVENSVYIDHKHLRK